MVLPLHSNPHASADSFERLEVQQDQASFQVCHICGQRQHNDILLGLKRLCSCSDLQTTTSSGSSLHTVARIPVIELMPHFCWTSMEVYTSTPSWDAATQANSLLVPCQLGLLLSIIKCYTTQHFMITSLRHLQLNQLCATVSSRWLKSSLSLESASRLIMVGQDFMHQMVIKL